MTRPLVFTFLLGALLSSCGGHRQAGAAPRAPETADAIPSATLVNRDHRGVALSGYDPVAYFTEGRPVEGDANISAVHEGARYLFASDDHRWQFLREPRRFAPAFGGFCGYAASIGRVSPVDPHFWQIIGGRLVLQHNQHAYDLFNQEAAQNLTRADQNWAKLSARNGLPVHNVVNADREGVALGGYDPMSYFDGTPELGAPEHAARYGGATYHFASEQHRAKFEAEPARFAPAFGGFCGYAASIGLFARADPHIFVLVDGRLVLQHTPEALQLFNRDPKASLRRAETNWPALVARAGL